MKQNKDSNYFVRFEIAVTDEKIDEIVYELYGITEKERRIVEDKK